MTSYANWVKEEQQLVNWWISEDAANWVRESSFNMTRGDEDIECGLQKVLDTWKGGSEKIRGNLKICILQNQQEGARAPKKLNR